MFKVGDRVKVNHPQCLRKQGGSENCISCKAEGVIKTIRERNLRPFVVNSFGGNDGLNCHFKEEELSFIRPNYFKDKS